MVLTVAMVMTACNSTSGSSAPATSSTTTTTRPVPPPGGSVAWLELDSPTVTAGGTIRGTVVIVNDTGSTITSVCGSPYVAGVETPYGLQSTSRSAVCSPPQSMPVGESRWPIVALAKYDLCSEPATTTRPPCQADHTPPPIPTGTTRVVVMLDQMVPRGFPVPAPVSITID